MVCLPLNREIFCGIRVNIFCFVERRRSTPAPKEEEKVNEEQWSLREVVFVEDVKNVPVGKVGASGIWPLSDQSWQLSFKSYSVSVLISVIIILCPLTHHLVMFSCRFLKWMVRMWLWSFPAVWVARALLLLLTQTHRHCCRTVGSSE